MDSENNKNRVLIVDDNQANCELLEAYLDGIECDTAIAEDGQQALEMVPQFWESDGTPKKQPIWGG